MGFPDDSPQTVDAALKEQWTWLEVWCAHCRRGHRVDLHRQDRAKPLAAVARVCRCTTCPEGAGRSYLAFKLVAEWVSTREKPVGFSGLTTRKIGMN